MGIFQQRPALRWLAPLSLVLVVGGTGAVVTQAQADPTLPAKSAAQLLVDLQNAEVGGLSGTVVQQANLGLPAIPSTGGATSEELTSLLSGSHQLRVWYAGPDKSRVAVLDDLGETDVVVNGTDLWTYVSKTNEATHRVLPDAPSGDHRRAPDATDVPKTPQEAADRVLEAVGPTTTVSTDASVTVAGRDAYELVLTPKDDRSLIGQVRVAIDAKTSVPLRVETLSTAGDDIATVGFTTVDFTSPDAAQFDFNPPPGAKVTEATTPQKPAGKPSKAEREAATKRTEQAKAETKVVGEGWTTVVVTKVGKDAGANAQFATVLNSLKPVSGSWGSGRQFEGPAFSAILTDDGRLAVGAVKPDLLDAALAK